jgi:hypothetical protein
MKHFLPLLFLLPTLLFAQTVWNGTADTTWYTDFKDNEEFVITTAEQLAGLALLTSYSEDNGTYNMEGKTITLGNDIALNDTTGWQIWDSTTTGLNEWTIAQYRPFYGTFDGNGYVISGIYGEGLFGSNVGTIKNLGITASYTKVGKNGNGMGGLALYNSRNNYVEGVINNCYFNGTVIGGWGAGGLVGSNYGMIINSYSSGTVITDGYYVGGLAGWNVNGTIRNSYSSSTVTGKNDVGGLVGDHDRGFIENSYSTGKVTGTENTFSGTLGVGGLVGYIRSGSISNSYSTSNVIGKLDVGGLAGRNSGSVSNSYFSGTVTGEKLFGYTDGAVINSGIKTTLQMQNKASYTGWDFDNDWHIDPFFNNGMPYFQWQNEMQLAISHVEDIEPKLYTGSKIEPKPKVYAQDGTELMPDVDFEYKYAENIHVANGGTVYIVGIKYYGTKIVDFIIKPIRTVNVYWTENCGVASTYGDSKCPTPYTIGSDPNVVAESECETSAGIGHIAIAKLETLEGNEGVGLQNDVCPYTINKKQLAVKWDEQREFVYNKMVQYPKASAKDGNTEIPLTVTNIHSAAGVYTGQSAAMAIITNEILRENYILLNNTADYEIAKKDLTPYFPSILPNDFPNNPDTLWVPREIFTDSAALHNALLGLIDYDGFATDTTKAVHESDDATVLRGTPKIILQYPLPAAPSPLASLSKRTETTEKATATIVTSDVSADNYALTRPSISIMATVEEDGNAEKKYCRLGDNYAELSESVCDAIGGKIIEEAVCIINSTCIKNLPASSCKDIGGMLAEACGQTPIASHFPLTASQLKIWQTASGTVNIDLGYMPASPVKLEVYDLKGKLIATATVNTRFANIKANVSNGIYLFKANNRSTIKAL